MKSKGILFNENLLKNKAFRNPHIYNKLVEFVELDEIGSNFDRGVFDPYGFPSEAFADQVGKFISIILYFFFLQELYQVPEYDIILYLIQSGSAKETSRGAGSSTTAAAKVANTICRIKC